MPLLRCTVCRATYRDLQRDGVRYFHACGPIRRVRVQRDQAVIDVDLADALVTDTRLEELAIPRLNARDENVTMTLDARGAAVARPKADGTGATVEIDTERDERIDGAAL